MWPTLCGDEHRQDDDGRAPVPLMSDASIRSRVDGAVLVVELARPQQLNALTRPMLGELVAALAHADDSSVHAVVLAGLGRGFCAGQDLDEVLTDPADSGDRLRTSYQPAITALSEIAKPTFAAIGGVCAGAGIALAAACDFRIASSRAWFAPAFITLALVPDAGASWFLTRLLGYSAAAHWLLSGRRLDADEAHALGLVNEVIADDDLLGEVVRRAQELAEQPLSAVVATKMLLREGRRNSLETQFEFEAKTQGSLNKTKEHRAALDAIRRSRQARSEGGG